MIKKLDGADPSWEDLIFIENLFVAWSEFRQGKKNKRDVQKFERHLEDNLFALHQSLVDGSYCHGGYDSFFVHDPKRRHIHKATVSDRVIHHLLYKYLYRLCDKSFIFDSYSCRISKGTHKAVDRLEKFARVVSRNYTEDCWALKMDINKFFASVDHDILLTMLGKKTEDKKILVLLTKVIDSFRSDSGERRGIPLGNLTSQVFANIYLHELDKFIKQELRVKYYLRYADDFLILDARCESLENLIVPISNFLQNKLKLELHPSKIVLRKLDWGIDFLGYIVLPHYRLPRTKTKRRIFRKLREGVEYQSLQSYLGYLSHANTFKLRQLLLNYTYDQQENFFGSNYSSGIFGFPGLSGPYWETAS